MDTELIKRNHIIKILDCLHFDSFLKKYSPKIVITSESFDKLTYKQFSLICYFLFYQLNSESCHLRFRGVFPSRDLQQEAEFRQLAAATINELVDKNKNELVKLKKIPHIHYQRLNGCVFVEQMFNLSLYVLINCSQKIKYQSTIDELQKFKTFDEREKFVEEQSLIIDQYRDDLKQSEERIDTFVKIYEKRLQEINDKSSLIENFEENTNHLVEKNQFMRKKLQKITANIENVNKRFEEMIESKDIASLSSAATHNDNCHINSTNFILNLRKFIHIYQEFIEMSDDSRANWLKTFKEFKSLNENFINLDQKFREILMKSIEIDQRKSEILSHEFTKKLFKQMQDYLQPLMDLDLKLKIN